MRAGSYLTFALLTLISMGCQSQTQSASSLNCPKIQGVGQLLGPDGPEIIVIGEFHGMTAPPEFVMALTCHSLEAGLSTSLALELSDDEGHLAAYLGSTGSDQAKADLFKGAMWAADYTTGQTSQAVLALIEQARDWTTQGLNLRTYPFAGQRRDKTPDETRNESAAAWEVHMADGVLDATSGRDKTIVLVGNLHAGRGRIEFGGLNYAAMASYLPAEKSQTFNVVTTRGTAWYCTPAGCGEGRAGGPIESGHPFAQDEPKIIRSEDMTVDLQKTLRFNGDKYDGVVFLGQAKASAPANADNRLPLEVD